MNKLKQHMNAVVTAGIVLLMLIGSFLFYKNKSEPIQPVASEQVPILREAPKAVEQKKETDNIEKTIILIDVQGSVKNPGVYEMKAGDRVFHAINKAGGFSNTAEERSVNQAQRISDEMIIYVAAEGEEYDVKLESSEEETNKKININTADSTELQTLSGVGPSKANSIISYRDENGPFTTIEQLLEIRGIGEKTIEEWGDKIKFD
jgi:competence protein ComEA